jgi:tRNA(Ile)-lysidine synthase
MKYLLAVSGGVDSVVMLDLLVRHGGHELMVAHFDHGIRDDSAADARFVAGLAAKYHLPFVTTREVLGVHASEELARTRRYAFLRQEAAKRGAVIATAHHVDDAIETIAINIHRGTGWRGLAVLDNTMIFRPLLGMSKRQIRAYAGTHGLEWVEDSTNTQAVYLRNKLRQVLASHLTGEQVQALVALWHRQVVLRTQIDGDLQHYVGDGEYSRYFFIQIDSSVACELLRAIIFAMCQQRPTRPQTERALVAIKTAKAGSVYEIGKGNKLRFKQRAFVVETP